MAGEGRRLGRGRALLGLVVAIAGGYLLRFHAPVPEPVRDAAGGAFYVLAAAISAVLLWPEIGAGAAAAAGFMLTSAVEFSQLVHTPWLQNARATLPGRLVLGTTFSWSDFPAYAVGALLAWGLIAILSRETHSRSETQARGR